jgi:hypothetical protein
MGRPASIQATYDATTGKQAPVKGQAIAGAQFSLSNVKDPAALARALTTLDAKVGTATQLGRSVAATQLYKNLTVSTSTNLTIQHSLMRPAQWCVVGWRSASAGPSFVEVSRDNATLTLKAFTAGVADIELR